MTTALRFTPRSSIADVAYPKDAIIVCRNFDCGKPLYRLQASLYLGEPLARSAWKYAPVSVSDLMTLIQRDDLEPGQRAAIKAMGLDAMKLHCDSIQTLRPGSFSDCPSCKQSFVFGKIAEDRDGGARFGDKGYTIALAFIPPVGRASVRL